MGCGTPRERAEAARNAFLFVVQTDSATAIAIIADIGGAQVMLAVVAPEHKVIKLRLRHRAAKGRRATTHWAVLHLLPFFGAIPVNQRVVDDGGLLSTAGVTAGVDGALRLAAKLRGDEEAQAIQLFLQYAPEPPFACGKPETAPPGLIKRVRSSLDAITDQRQRTAKRIATRLGLYKSRLHQAERHVAK